MFLLPTKPYMPGIAAPSHLSPFIDNEAEGYLPERAREINALAGIESAVTGPALGEASSDEEEDKKEEEAAAAGKTKGDIDSSSDEEGTSEELSDSEEEMVDTKKAPNAGGKKKSAKQVKAV